MSQSIRQKFIESCKGPSTYQLSSWLFLRGLGFIYLVAFVSFWIQSDGLVSSQGIYPVQEHLDAIDAFCEANEGRSRLGIAPSLLWLGASDTGLTILLATGSICSLLLMTGLVTPLVTFACWLCYLSLVTAVPRFLNFQWDSLLLEVGVLGILFSPWRWWENPRAAAVYSGLTRWLIAWLLFRLMYESGIVKLNSYAADGSNTWRDLTALNFHYFTQPIPHGLSYYFHHLPDWMHQFSIWFMFFVELVVPFFLFTPKPIRNLALLALIALQLLIMLSGNYGFFNLLTILLCIPLIADQSFPAFVRKWIPEPAEKVQDSPFKKWLPWMLRVPCAAVIILISTLQFMHAHKWIDLHGHDASLPQPPQWTQSLKQSLAPYRSINGYGLFRVMTTTRPEIIIEGSNDGVTWQPYLFKWKPVELDTMPGCMIPHMPRLDWQMWFAGLIYEGSGQFRPWFVRFINQLQKNNPTVTALLRENPFPDAAPQYIRISLHHYTYTSPEERKETGNYWKRELLPRYSRQYQTPSQ